MPPFKPLPVGAIRPLAQQPERQKLVVAQQNATTVAKQATAMSLEALRQQQQRMHQEAKLKQQQRMQQEALAFHVLKQQQLQQQEAMRQQQMQKLQQQQKQQQLLAQQQQIMVMQNKKDQVISVIFLYFNLYFNSVFYFEIRYYLDIKININRSHTLILTLSFWEIVNLYINHPWLLLAELSYRD